jgi:hypothetical protein
VTYVKQLDSAISTNSDVIANLSSIVKDVVIKSHDRFKEITRDVIWFNPTLYGLSELYVVIRQIEFAILRLQKNLDELVDATECVLLAELPISLVSPQTLHNMLVNISRYLPESCEGVTGSRFANLYGYYDTIKVAILRNTHTIRLILNVPLKTANRNLILYKLVPLPTPVLNKTSVPYKPKFMYFAFNEIQHRYALLTEAEVDRCIGGRVAMCPADTAVYSTKVITCESSLYFQTMGAHRLCQRHILSHSSTPTWTRHDTLWFYHVPEPLQVTFRCLENQHGYRSRGTGLVLQASRCFILPDAFVVHSELTA